MSVYYSVGTALAKLFFRAFAQWEVEGREAVPPKGPLILASNHLSNADPPFLVASVPRRLHFLGKRGLFANPVASSILSGIGSAPNKPGRAGLRCPAVEHAAPQARPGR